MIVFNKHVTFVNDADDTGFNSVKSVVKHFIVAEDDIQLRINLVNIK